MKKLVAVLLGGLGFATLLLNCGGKDKTEGKIVVKTMTHADNSNAEGQAWVRMVEAFHKENPDVYIDYEMLFDEAYHQKVVTRLASGDIPHLAFMGADARWGTPWEEAGQRFDHRGLIDENFYDLSLIPPMGPQGEIYEIPQGVSNATSILFANETLINELGFELPRTYEDMVAMVPLAKAAGIDVVSIAGANGWVWSSCLLSTLIARTSGDPSWPSKAVAGEYKFTDPPFVAALGLIEQMVQDEVIPSKSVLVDLGAATSSYNNSQSLFLLQGQWETANIENPTVAEGTVLMSLPRMPGEKDSTKGSIAAAISVGYGLTQEGAADPQVVEAALRFLKYIYSYEESTQRLRDGAIVAPILKGYEMPKSLSPLIAQKAKLMEGAVITDVVDAFLTGAPNEALNEGIQRIVSGQATPEEVAAEIEGLLR